MYIETHYVTPRCHLSVVALDFWEVHDSQRQTFENVFLIYKAARRPRVSKLSDGAKIKKKAESSKLSAVFFIFAL